MFDEVIDWGDVRRENGSNCRQRRRRRRSSKSPSRVTSWPWTSASNEAHSPSLFPLLRALFAAKPTFSHSPLSHIPLTPLSPSPFSPIAFSLSYYFILLFFVRRILCYYYSFVCFLFLLQFLSSLASLNFHSRPDLFLKNWKKLFTRSILLENNIVKATSDLFSNIFQHSEKLSLLRRQKYLRRASNICAKTVFKSFLFKSDGGKRRSGKNDTYYNSIIRLPVSLKSMTMLKHIKAA